MKSFSANFFDKSNFIVSVKKFLEARKQDESSIVHICYNVNNDYFFVLGASIISVLENNPELVFAVHIFTDGCSKDNENKIAELAKKWKCNCYIYTLNMIPFKDFHIKVKRFSRITYARLIMPKILYPNVLRYIYIDADAIVIKSILPLEKWNLKGAAMAAVSDTPDSVIRRGGFLKLKSGKYFNDGIMVVDVNTWEKLHITEKAFSYQGENPKRFIGQSQDVLNLVFDGTNCFLPDIYNCFAGYSNNPNATIIHWTGRRKPWQMVLNKFDKKWRHYNELSPWKTITNIRPIKKAENYHDFQQWGRYKKKQGNIREYLYGIFWYALLRIKFKLHV